MVEVDVGLGGVGHQVAHRLQEVPVPYLHMGLELLGDTDTEVVELDAFRAVEEGCPMCG